MEISNVASVHEFARSWLVNRCDRPYPDSAWRFYLNHWADGFPIHLMRESDRKRDMEAAIQEARLIASLDLVDARHHVGMSHWPGPATGAAIMLGLQKS